jgi:hypothetical protein
MRVLFVIGQSGLARNFEWVLRVLIDRRHQVVVAVERQPGGATRLSLAEPLASLAGALPGLKVVHLAGRGQRTLGSVGVAARLWLDYLRYLEPPYARAVQPRQRAASLAPLSRRLGPLFSWSTGLRATVAWTLRVAEEQAPIPGSVERLLRDSSPDVVIVTPLVEPGGSQVEIVRAARALRIPTLLAVASWDNLTLKGGLHVHPDVIAVWNAAQAREGIELHQMTEERIVVTGAVAYDHWFDWQPATSREAFCDPIGLDPTRPYVVYVGSSKFIAPDEGHFALEWATAVRAAIPSLQVLVRPHPENPFGHAEEAIIALAGVIVHPRAGENPVTNARRAAYFDSLWHAAAIVGVNTSALVEGALIGRPVLTLLSDRYRATQEGTLHFDHLLPERGGPLHVSKTVVDHVEALERCLIDPGAASVRNARFVERFVRPRGRDVSASEVLVELVESMAEREALIVSSRKPCLRAFGRLMLVAGLPFIRLRSRG